MSSRSKKAAPPHTALSLRPSSDLAVPGGPRRSKCSPQKAARRSKRTSVSRSTSPDSSDRVAARILGASSGGAPDAGDASSPSSPSPSPARIGARISSTLALTLFSSTEISASCSLCLVFQSGSADDRTSTDLPTRTPRRADAMDRRVRPAAAGHVVAGIACAMEEAIVARVVGRAGRTRLTLRIGLDYLAGFSILPGWLCSSTHRASVTKTRSWMRFGCSCTGKQSTKKRKWPKNAPVRGLRDRRLVIP